MTETNENQVAPLTTAQEKVLDDIIGDKGDQLEATLPADASIPTLQAQDPPPSDAEFKAKLDADLEAAQKAAAANAQQQAAPAIVETHEQAAEINVARSAEQGYVKVGDQVP